MHQLSSFGSRYRVYEHTHKSICTYFFCIRYPELELLRVQQGMELLTNKIIILESEQTSESYDPALHLMNKELNPSTLADCPKFTAHWPGFEPRATILKYFLLSHSDIFFSCSHWIWPGCPPGARAARDKSLLVLFQLAFPLSASTGKLWASPEPLESENSKTPGTAVDFRLQLHPAQQTFYSLSPFLCNLSCHPSSASPVSLGVAGISVVYKDSSIPLDFIPSLMQFCKDESVNVPANLKPKVSSFCERITSVKHVCHGGGRQSFHCPASQTRTRARLAVCAWARRSLLK